jgi:hypothetical protein
MRYKFRIQRKDDTSAGWISLGSYETINQYEQEIGRLKEGEHLFHLDGYSPSDEAAWEKHYTYGFFAPEPSYREVREMAFKVIDSGSWQTDAISSSTNNPNANDKIE